MSYLKAIIVGFILSLFSMAAMGQDLAQEEQNISLEKAAKKSNNPISDIWLMVFQNDATILDGDLVEDTQIWNNFKFQPVISIPFLEDSWNFVVRPVFAFNSLPLDSDVGNLVSSSLEQIFTDPALAGIASSPFGRNSGLGDTVLLTLAGPNTEDGWIYAGGISQIFPTATDDLLGQGKYQIGPAALIARLGNSHGDFTDIESWNIGVLPQQWWSVAGPEGRSFANHADIQYFINYKLNATQMIGMTPNISINWNADGGFSDKVSLPVGLGTIGMFRLGKVPVRWGAEAQYYLTGPENVRRQANFRLFFAPIIPNLFK
ncbi:hypothetical protein [Polycladidibacter stylochi]|uniref:hypothetical protein n=1 Tax=Polycladidibacter stylochi TaxID=1807766 RepID=UPI0008369608|nr:hypothetical protein [Pseudovibrio stylochi]